MEQEVIMQLNEHITYVHFLIALCMFVPTTKILAYKSPLLDLSGLIYLFALIMTFMPGVASPRTRNVEVELGWAVPT